jgi:hypothetical protein
MAALGGAAAPRRVAPAPAQPSSAEPIFVPTASSNTARRLPPVEMVPQQYAGPPAIATPAVGPVPASAPNAATAGAPAPATPDVTTTGAQARVTYAPQRMLDRGAQKIAAAAGVSGEAPITYTPPVEDLKTMPMSALLALSRTKAPNVDDDPPMMDMLSTSDMASKFLTTTAADRPAFNEHKRNFAEISGPTATEPAEMPADLMSTSDMAAKFMGTSVATPFSVLGDAPGTAAQPAMDPMSSDHIPAEFVTTTLMAAKTSFGAPEDDVPAAMLSTSFMAAKTAFGDPANDPPATHLPGSDDVPAAMLSTTAMAAKYGSDDGGGGSAFDAPVDEDSAMDDFAKTQQMPGGFVKAAKHADPDGPGVDFVTPFDLGDVKPVAKPTFDNLSRTGQSLAGGTGQYMNLMGNEGGLGKTTVLSVKREEDGATELLPGGFAGSAKTAPVQPAAVKPTPPKPATTNTGSPIKLTQDMLAPMDVKPVKKPGV